MKIAAVCCTFLRPKQLGRLPGDLRAVYGEFIEKKAQTPRVTLPKDLKDI